MYFSHGRNTNCGQKTDCCRLHFPKMAATVSFISVALILQYDLDHSVHPVSLNLGGLVTCLNLKWSQVEAVAEVVLHDF